mmetsp:Transcript_100334/g.239215  ORF Transcript_100334/g.239215 Transcript_100334/m.239215 type:complete len:200 (+) Transcript_100334:317-916(+)
MKPWPSETRRMKSLCGSAATHKKYLHQGVVFRAKYPDALLLSLQAQSARPRQGNDRVRQVPVTMQQWVLRRSSPHASADQGRKFPSTARRTLGEACEALSTSLGRVHHPARGAMSQTCRTPRQFDLHRLSSTVRSALEIGCHVAHPGLAITRRQHILLGWMRWRRRRLSQSAPHLLPSEVAKSVSVLSLQRPMHPERWR